ncbi:hypothetical protein ACP70R_008101 [Stipagrostis hirtigluma subsp. patula]
MASAAILRSAARSLRSRQLDGLPARRFAGTPGPRLLSSSAPTERHRCSPPLDTQPRGAVEHKGQIKERKEDICERISTKMDKIVEGLDQNSHLLRELEIRVKENSKHDKEPSDQLDTTSCADASLFPSV